MLKYYDSCVFGSAMNPAHPHHAACLKVTDVNDIGWSVCLNVELTKGEFPSCADYLDEFFVYAQLSGIDVRVAQPAAVKIHARNFKAEKRSLDQMGFSGNDWTHLISAAYLESEKIYSVDDDFFDPAMKSGGKGKNLVAKFIKSKFAMEVSRP